MTSVLCLFFRPKTVHCSTKNAYTSEITFLALYPCSEQSLSIVLLLPEAEMQLLQPLCFYVRASPPKHTARHQNKKMKLLTELDCYDVFRKLIKGSDRQGMVVELRM